MAIARHQAGNSRVRGHTPLQGDGYDHDERDELTLHLEDVTRRNEPKQTIAGVISQKRDRRHNLDFAAPQRSNGVMLTLISWVSLGIAFICAIIIAIDEVRHPQKMWIMNVVWPVSALYFSVFGLWGYFRIGRGMAKDARRGMAMGDMQRAARDPTWRQTAVSDSHCGAGCVIGDVISEFSLFALGWTLLGKSLYAEYAGDLLLAWLFGIAFQYFAIKPMGNLSVKQGLIAAIKSDTLSIITFEIGLFGWMALTFFLLFPDPPLRPTQASYWLMMQIGMILGFFTSYPMNRWLIKAGWKEAME